MDTPERERLASTASEWLVRMESGTITAAERLRFTEWLSSDPAHQEAYRKAERFWHALDQVNPHDIHEFDRYLTEDAPTTPREHSHSWRRVTAMAASLLLVAGIGLWLTTAWLLLGDYRTAVGEQRTVSLADGSIVQLNTDTALSVSLTEQGRRLTLHRGEAFFTVAPDTARPFEVEAGSGTIRALGTAFNVRTGSDRTTVTVTEHSIRIRVGKETSADVHAGERLRYRPDGRIDQVEEADIDRTLAWRHHRLIFENQPLPEVLAEVARYRSGRLVILRDDSLKTLPVTGSFDTERLDHLLPAIEESLPVRVVTFADRVILLYRGLPKKS
ncbi:MAG: FecR family protein [Nitrospira sp.]|nr:FecR family protein [Nitrospira sp.]